MKISFAVMAAAALLAAAPTSASACEFFRCWSDAVSDDLYPPGEPTLDPGVRAAVQARRGLGLSLAGFYNDPFVALAQVAPPPPERGWRRPHPPLRRSY